MIRFILRASGFLIFAAGFIAFIADGTKSLAANAVVLTPASDSWASLDASSLAAFQALVKGLDYPYIWDPGVVTLLQAPTFAVLGIAGALLILLGTKRNKQPEKTYYR